MQWNHQWTPWDCIKRRVVAHTLYMLKTNADKSAVGSPTMPGAPSEITMVVGGACTAILWHSMRSHYVSTTLPRRVYGAYMECFFFLLRSYNVYMEPNRSKLCQTDPNWSKVSQTDQKWAKPIKNVPNQSKVSQTNPKLAKMSQTDLKCAKLIQSEPNQSKVSQTDLKWAKLIQSEPNWSKVSKNDLKWAKLIQSEPNWFKVILKWAKNWSKVS